MRKDFKDPKVLSELKPGQKAQIQELQNQGAMRRRLLDLGLIPGTEISCIGRSPLGDPCAYLVRQTLVALRKKDARQILLQEAPEWKEQ